MFWNRRADFFIRQGGTGSKQRECLKAHRKAREGKDQGCISVPDQLLRQSSQ
jgi:hypothetical protein